MGFVDGDIDSDVINLLNCVKKEVMNVFGLAFGILLFETNFRYTIGGKSIIINSCGGCVGITSVVNVTFDGSEKIVYTSVNHFTRLYLCENRAFFDFLCQRRLYVDFT